VRYTIEDTYGKANDQKDGQGVLRGMKPQRKASSDDNRGGFSLLSAYNKNSIFSGVYCMLQYMHSIEKKE
jgi:hypothetical protein